MNIVCLIQRDNPVLRARELIVPGEDDWVGVSESNHSPATVYPERWLRVDTLRTRVRSHGEFELTGRTRE
jgi:hypothetical protein